MRRILIDRARRKQAQKHGGGQVHVDVNDALDKLAARTRKPPTW